MATVLSFEMKLLFVFLISFFVIRIDCEVTASSWKQYKVKAVLHRLEVSIAGRYVVITF